MTARLRRAGSPWRILVHTYDGNGRYEDAWHVANDRRFGGGDGQDTTVEVADRVYHSRHTELPDTEFDELVVGGWCHIEQMDTGRWWMNIAGVTLHVTADRDGRPTAVTVHGPDDFADAEPNCSYDLYWSKS
jgi:hypothetical protein